MDKTIGVIFLGSKRTTPKGNEYYTGKLDGSEEFDLIAWVNTSKSGKQYLLIKQREIQKKEEEETNGVKSNYDGIAIDGETVDVNDLPF